MSHFSVCVIVPDDGVVNNIPVSYTHLDVYKRQLVKTARELSGSMVMAIWTSPISKNCR